MRKFDDTIKDTGYLIYRWTSLLLDPIKIINSTINFPRYLMDMYKYSKMKEAEPVELINTYPIINERSNSHPFDDHYFYQDIWASTNIYRSKTKKHFDVGSKIDFVAFISTFTKVEFVDIRPLKIKLRNFKSVKGDVAHLPFETNSIRSLSCLHVAEHIGLGRYGDKLDPRGTQKACKELSRVLAKNGRLYFSLPIGKPRLCFNAHRVHSPKQIVRYFRALKLLELSGIDDDGHFTENIDINVLERSNYACGLFMFTKK